MTKSLSLQWRCATKIKHAVCVLAFGWLASVATLSAQTPLYFGWSSVAPDVADFDGDGRFELGFYDSNKGALSARELNGDQLAFDMQIALGGFTAALADYDGDRKADLGSYDRTTGIWYVWLSSEAYATLGYFHTASGNSLVEPVPADYDGDGKADPALYESSSGIWIIYYSSLNYQPASGLFGGSDMLAVPADYDGDRKTDPAVYDAASGQFWTLFSSTQYGLVGAELGGPGCVAASADFDGDGLADPTVYYSALGIWGTLHSTSNYALNIIQQGGPNCLPVPGHYYFTNRADYALYNPVEASWQVSYDGVQGIIAKIALIIIGQLLSRIDDFTLINTKKNNDGQQCLEQLREVNQKLDALLNNQSALQSQLNELARQLQYESEKTRLLIEGLSAKDAITKIKTYFDFGGIDGYQTFYQCDTNNLPPNDAVLYFANAVLDNGIKEAVTEIHDAILPADLANGLLRQWAALSAFTLTLDNLADHHAAFYDYFLNLYAYQMKGVCMYVDSAQVVNTSAWAKAATYAYVTNDVMTMISEEVDEFRSVTCEMILRALNANYNPYATNHPFSPFPDASAREILATTEFMAHQCLGQTQGLCTTFLVVDRPEVVSNYSRATAARLDQEEPAERWPLAVATNRMESKPYYGYMNPDLKNITIADDYAVLRHDFGQVPVGAYRVYDSSGQALGDVTVTNYDATMTPTNDPSITNWFGHLADASSFNLTQLSLPVENTNQWVLYTPAHYHYKDKWSNTRIFDTWPQSFKNFSLGMKLWYEYSSAYHLPDSHGGYNFTYFAFPFALSNSIGSNVQVRVHFCADNPDLKVSHIVKSRTHGQWFWISDTGGSVVLLQSTDGGVVTNSASWFTTSGKWREDPKKWGEYYFFDTNVYKGCLSADLHSTASHTSTVTVALGGVVQPWQDCWMGGAVWDHVDVWTEVEFSYNLRYAILSFY